LFNLIHLDFSTVTRANKRRTPGGVSDAGAKRPESKVTESRDGTEVVSIYGLRLVVERAEERRI
jgi:hypothetical protein